MFRFRTDHTNQERRDGFVSFRCFLWLGGGGEEDEEDGNGNRGGGRDFERMEEDGRGVGEDGHGTLRREKQGFREDENRTSNR